VGVAAWAAQAPLAPERAALPAVVGSVVQALPAKETTQKWKKNGVRQYLKMQKKSVWR
jgi:hypothetical protein